MEFDKILQIDYDEITMEFSGRMRKERDDSLGNIFTDSDLEAWKKTRRKALDILLEELNRHSSKSCSLLILMDDNFHLRSMRHDVYKVCKDYLISTKHASDSQILIGFSVVYVCASISECISNNFKRIGIDHIPERVIKKMSQTLEPPDTRTTNFESSNCRINMESVKLTMGNSCKLEEPCYPFISIIDQTIRKSVLNHVKIPISNMEKTQSQLEQERKATLSSFHAYDLMLRKLVGAISRVERSCASSANEARKLILKELKEGKMIDASLNMDNVDTHNSILNIDKDKYVLKRFQEVLLKVNPSVKATIKNITESVHLEFLMAQNNI